MPDEPQGDREFQEAQQRNQHSFEAAQQQRQHLFEEVHQDIEHRHENLRDGRRRLFEARKEYAAHTIDEIRFVNEAFREYGLQTFKWAFLANAGAAALILALAGAIASRSNLDISITRHLTISVIPFGLGCVFVILGGFFAYVNFSFYREQLPTSEHIHLFLADDSVTKWPSPRGLGQGEALDDYQKRIGKGVKCTQGIAIGFGLASVLAFLLGVVWVWETFA